MLVKNAKRLSVVLLLLLPPLLPGNAEAAFNITVSRIYIAFKRWLRAGLTNSYALVKTS